MIDGCPGTYQGGAMIEFVHIVSDFSLDPWFLAVFVLLADGLIGDPGWLYNRISHPVVLIGGLIRVLEKKLNREKVGNTLRFVFGAMTAVIVIASAIAVGILITLLCERIPFGALVLILVSSSLIACRGLYDAVTAVGKGLAVSLEEGRVVVSQIVGRDPASLDEAGVTRAAIESLAENFSDGTAAPLFWFLLFGLPGLIFYKAVNTLDSMIGHHSERYEFFGKFAARLDDAVNYVPARLTGLLIAAAALILPGTSGRMAFRCLMTDARRHKSVNAGWQEAAFAGALDVALAGPRYYGGTRIDDVWMNASGCKEPDGRDIRRALRLYLGASGFLLTVLAGLAIHRFS